MTICDYPPCGFRMNLREVLAGEKGYMAEAAQRWLNNRPNTEYACGNAKAIERINTGLFTYAGSSPEDIVLHTGKEPVQSRIEELFRDIYGGDPNQGVYRRIGMMIEGPETCQNCSFRLAF